MSLQLLDKTSVAPAETSDLTWHIEASAALGSWPLRKDGIPDYTALVPSRAIKAGQVLAEVPDSDDARASGWTAGPGVRLTGQKRFIATLDGFLETAGGYLRVHPIVIIEGDLKGQNRHFPTGVVILGSVIASIVQSEGVVAVRGNIAGSEVQAQDGIFLTRAGRSVLHTDSNVFITDTLRHCEVIACRNVVGLDGGTIVGGNVTAGIRAHAAEIGAADGSDTFIHIGSDRLNAFRLDKIEREIEEVKANVHRIAQALRPLSATKESLSADKKCLVEALVQQRTQLENRLPQLFSLKRTALLGGTHSENGRVTVSGAIYPGVKITIGPATLKLDQIQRGRAFSIDPGKLSILNAPISEFEHRDRTKV